MKKSTKAASPTSPESSPSKAPDAPSENASVQPPANGAAPPFRLGKDEMNLVEHPFALLRRGATDSVIHLEWDKTHPRTGKTVHAEWRVSGDPILGLPGPVEERLYLVLMELSREQGFPQRVIFSRGDILRRLSIADTAQNYATLHDAFLRLKTVTIDAKRSFWNVAAQDFSAHRMFNILDDVEVVDEAAGRRKGQVSLALSSFLWSEVMYSSIVAGNIRSLSIDFALSLELPLSARLFRYLDKHRTGDKDRNHNKFEIELHRLCEIHLGMTRARYPSKLKERLAPAFRELTERGFLAQVKYEPMKSQIGAEKVVFGFTGGLLNGQVSSDECGVLNDGQAAGETPIQHPSLITGHAEVAGAPAPTGSPATSPAGSPTGFSPIDLILSWDMEDEEARGAACDAVFKELDDATQENIEKGLWEVMPPFLQNNRSLPGARSTLARHRRARVLSDYGDRVRAVLEEAARAETGERRASVE